MSLGPDGVTSIQSLFEQAHDTGQMTIFPQEACAWVNPADASDDVDTLTSDARAQFNSKCAMLVTLTARPQTFTTLTLAMEHG